MNIPRELRRLLVCSMCRRSYDPTIGARLPKELSCQHSYCAACVEQLMSRLDVTCPQCGQQTQLPVLGELPTTEGLLFLLQQLPALRLGRLMLQQRNEQQLQPNSSNVATTGWVNWLDNLSVANFLRAGNEYCLLHATPNTIWCHGCHRLICDICATCAEHNEHKLTRQLDLTELLRQLISNEIAKIELTMGQTNMLATDDSALLRRLCEACDTVQQHIQRLIAQHNPTLRSFLMRDWWNRTNQQLQHRLQTPGVSAAALLRLLGELHEQHVNYNGQLLDVYRECRLRASIREGGLELLDFEQLQRRFWALHYQPVEPVPAIVEPPPALLLTNYCIYEYWIAMQSTEQEQRSQLAVLPAPVGMPQHRRNLGQWEGFGSSSNSNSNSSSSGGSGGSGDSSSSSCNGSEQLCHPAAQLFDNNDYNRLQLDRQLAALRRRNGHAEALPSVENWSMPSWVQALQQVAEPSPALAWPTETAAVAALPRWPSTLGSYPIYFLDMEMDGRPAGRVLIEVRDDVAPRMAANFRALVLHERGFGYRGCNVFQAWGNESLITGDFELHNGRGGYAALEHRFFMPDNTGLQAERGTVGMRRGQKRHDSSGFVGSQFRLVLGELPVFTAIFGFIVEGIDTLDTIASSGDLLGRPTMRTYIRNCGEYRRDNFLRMDN